MNSILDYIAWRGDLDFSVAPYNIVDNLIFSQISYFDFSNIVSEDVNESIALKDAWKIYKVRGRKVQNLLLGEHLEELFTAMAKSKRFSDILLSGYVAHINETIEKQFAAMCINFGDGMYVAFRGTDDSLVGWKEDFNLAFMETVPAQREALEYLVTVIRETEDIPIYVGGHSKGGNLSIYSSVNLIDELKERIVKVYNNDGPGFSEEFIKGEAYLKMKSKILNIAPEGSIVGQLLHHSTDDIIIKSEKTMLLQHDPFTWEVMKDDFILADKLKESSKKIDIVVKKWLMELSFEEREALVESMFEMLRSSDAKTLTDINNDKLGFIKALSKVDKEKKKHLGKSFSKMLEQAAKLMIKKE